MVIRCIKLQSKMLCITSLLNVNSVNPYMIWRSLVQSLPGIIKRVKAHATK